jgi:hypothetical protein
MAGAYLLNMITAACTLTPSTENSVYPVENIYGEQASNVFRSTSTTSLVIEMDFGAAVSLDTIAIINHNLVAGATFSVKAGAAPTPSTVVATPVFRAKDLYKIFTPVSARYWSLTIAGTNPSNIQIGQLLMGVHVDLPRARKIGGFTPATSRTSISIETVGGANWVYPLHKRKVFNPTFQLIGTSDLTAMETLDEVVDGDSHPFVYIPSITDVACYYVRKEQSFEPSETEYNLSEYLLLLREESGGLEISA